MTTFAEIVRSVASDNPDVLDYRELSERVLEEARGREMDLLQKLLPSYVRDVLSRRRYDDIDVGGWDSFMYERIHTSRGTIRVGDATPSDVEEAVAIRERNSKNAAKRNTLWRSIAKEMQSSGASLVSEITVKSPASGLRELEIQLAIERAQRASHARKARAIPALTHLRDQLVAMIERGESPTTRSLLARRDRLVQLVSEERESLDQVVKAESLWQEGYAPR